MSNSAAINLEDVARVWGVSDADALARLTRRDGPIGQEVNGRAVWSADALLAWKPQPTALYRHFDAAGILLYVGISVRPAQRQTQHRRRSPWFATIARTEIEWLPGLDEAITAEAKAIRSENPRHNKVKPRG